MLARNIGSAALLFEGFHRQGIVRIGKGRSLERLHRNRVAIRASRNPPFPVEVADFGKRNRERVMSLAPRDGADGEKT